jgi:metallopeptidase MepB
VSETKRPTEAALADYFELRTTLQRLLQLFEHLFGVRLVEIDTKAPDAPPHLTWYDDVQMFSAWNVDAIQPQFIGYAYLDLFTRAQKPTHAGHNSLQQVLLTLMVTDQADYLSW